MAIRIHTHECRECAYDIECTGRENSNGCVVWNGSNDGCYNCGPDICRGLKKNPDCSAEYRCGACYPAQPADDVAGVEHNWYEEAAEMRASAESFLRGDY